MNSSMYSVARRSSLLAVLALTACVTIPTGPSYTALPGSRTSYDQFQVDDANCRQFAVQATGGTPNDAAANAAVGSAVVGTVLGAAVGGLVGGGDGAAVGAGMGLLTGSAVGAGNAQVAGYSAQQRYDSSYYQCMYSRGHKVPMPASVVRSMRQSSNAAPYSVPPNAAIPPRNAPPPYAATPPRNAPPPAATPSSSAPPSDAAIPPPNAPPPYQPR